MLFDFFFCCPFFIYFYFVSLVFLSCPRSFFFLALSFSEATVHLCARHLDPLLSTRLQVHNPDPIPQLLCGVSALVCACVPLRDAPPPPPHPMIRINHLRYSGFSFYVMPVNFVIHAPHPKSVAKTVWEKTGGGKQVG